MKNPISHSYDLMLRINEASNTFLNELNELKDLTKEEAFASELKETHTVLLNLADVSQHLKTKLEVPALLEEMQSVYNGIEERLSEETNDLIHQDIEDAKSVFPKFQQAMDILLKKQEE